jgi:hypothetical protein
VEGFSLGPAKHAFIVFDFFCLASSILELYRVFDLEVCFGAYSYTHYS